MNDETEIPKMPLSHGLFPFLLILCFTSFRFPSSDYMYIIFPYLILASDFDLAYLFMPFPLLSFLHVSLAILT